MKRPAALLAAASLAALPLLANQAARAAAEPMSHCSTTTGVVVAVDFAHWGGPILRACGSTPTTAYTQLNQGGWRTAGDEHDGPGFICRIGYSGYHGGAQYPTAAQDACVLTPPASAYWALWVAGPGQASWSYSQTGSSGYAPRAGSVELWTFGGTSLSGTSGSAVPMVSPSRLRAANVAAPTAVPPKSSSDSSATPTAPATSTSAAATAPSPSSDPAPSPAASSPAPAISNAPPTAAAASQHTSHSSATPAIIALVIVLLLAAAGITAVLRRPRRER